MSLFPPVKPRPTIKDEAGQATDAPITIAPSPMAAAIAYWRNQAYYADFRAGLRESLAPEWEPYAEILRRSRREFGEEKR